jgi:hypothetical protein
MARWLAASGAGAPHLVSIFVGVILAALGLDPFDITHSVERLIRVIWNMSFDAVRWLWVYFLLGAVIVIPIWLFMRFLNVLPATFATKAGLQERNDHLEKSRTARLLQNLQVMKPEKVKHLQIIGALLIVFIVGVVAVQSSLNPAPYDKQAMIDLNYHPVASILGALVPAIILAPFVYWIFGRTFRRMAARYKVCEHCAETINSDTKICRYCGREVAPSAQ